MGAKIFLNECTLEPFSLEETTEFVGAVFGSASLDHQQLAEWLQRKTLGHPYFVAFISRELWSLYRTGAVAHAEQTEFTPGPFAQKFPHQYFKRLAKAGLRTRTGRGRYTLYHPLFREFLRQTK